VRLVLPWTACHHPGRLVGRVERDLDPRAVVLRSGQPLGWHPLLSVEQAVGSQQAGPTRAAKGLQTDKDISCAKYSSRQIFWHRESPPGHQKNATYLDGVRGFMQIVVKDFDGRQKLCNGSDGGTYSACGIDAWSHGTTEPHAPRVAKDPLCARGRGNGRWELGRRLGCGLGSQALAEIRGGIPLGSELAQLYGVGSGLGRLDKTGSRSDAADACSRRLVHRLYLLYRHGSAQGVPLATMPKSLARPRTHSGGERRQPIPGPPGGGRRAA
jgi:hypothetical protein